MLVKIPSLAFSKYKQSNVVFFFNISKNESCGSVSLSEKVMLSDALLPVLEWWYFFETYR